MRRLVIKGAVAFALFLLTAFACALVSQSSAPGLVAVILPLASVPIIFFVASSVREFVDLTADRSE